MSGRITTLIKRRIAAARLGITFKRSASFVLPKAIWLSGQMHPLKMPDQNGVKVAFIDLLLDDCYGCRTLQKCRENVNTVLDIGGNVGLFGLAARKAFPTAIIHSYEPNRLLEPYLSAQAAAAGFEFFLEAVGREGGMIALDLDPDSVQTRSRQDEKGDIPQISFREAIERIGGEVDLLKVDCEGHEWELFDDKDSWRYVKHVSMEYHLFKPWQTEQHVRNALADLGFFITSFRPGRNFGLVTATRHPCA